MPRARLFAIVSVLAACSSATANVVDSGPDDDASSVDVSSSVTIDAGGGPDSPVPDGMVTCGAGDSDAGLFANLDFQASALGTYDCPSTTTLPKTPAPWQGGECQGVGSEIIVYSSATDAGFPAPVCGDRAAAFESADPDTQTTVARIQVHQAVPMPDEDAGLGRSSTRATPSMRRQPCRRPSTADRG
jgi:hypothetical protein